MAKPKDVITQIRKATHRQFSAQEKIRIVLEGLRGETAISEICRQVELPVELLGRTVPFQELGGTRPSIIKPLYGV